MFSSSGKVRTTISGAYAKRSSDATQVITTAWFPMNRLTHRTILHKFDAGEYVESVAPILQHMKRDLSLFGYVVRATKSMSNGSVVVDPNAALMKLSQEEMRKILTFQEREVSTHKLAQADKSQLNALIQVVRGCAAAEVLAEEAKIEEEVAFLATFLRQVGLLLAAWNYPRLYHKALASAHVAEDQFKKELQQLVGHSLLSFGADIASECRLSPAIRSALQENPVAPIGTVSGGLFLGKISFLGERIGVLFGEEDATVARQRSEFLKELSTFPAIVSIPQVMQKVKKRSDEYLTDLLSAINPPTFDSAYAAPVGARSSGTSQVSKTSRPVAGGRMSGAIQAPPRDGASVLLSHFLDTYRTAKSGGKAFDPIDFLAKTILPAVGFEGGGLFAPDPASGTLIPLITFGRSRGLEVLSNSVNGKVVIAKALERTASCISLTGASAGSVSCMIAPMLDQGESAILYLEHNPNSRQDSGAQLSFYRVVAVYLKETMEWELPEG